MSRNNNTDSIRHDEVIGTLYAISITAKRLARSLAVQSDKANETPNKKGVKQNGKRKLFSRSRRTP